MPNIKQETPLKLRRKQLKSERTTENILISERVNFLIKKMTISQSLIAKEMGVSQSFISNILTEHQFNSVYFFIALSKITDVPIDWIINGNKQVSIPDASEMIISKNRYTKLVNELMNEQYKLSI